MREPIYYFTFCKKTAFMPLRYVYPECIVLRKDQPQTEGLQCLNTSCPVNAACMDVLARRIHYLFENVFPECELLLVYFKNEKGSIRAGVFYKDMREPYVMTCNRSGFAKFQREGTAFSWVPKDEYLLIRPGTDIIVPASALVRSRE